MILQHSEARETNRVWLESWGCRVEHLEWGVRIEHPEFPEFNAIYDIKDPNAVQEAARLAKNLVGQGRNEPSIYIPVHPRFTSAVNWLREVGYHPVFRTETVATKVLPERNRDSESKMELRGVTCETIDLWINLYLQNYQIPNARTAHEHHRWSTAFSATPELRFYLIRIQEVDVGTVQLVTPKNRWCGIYSVSIIRSRRGFVLFQELYRRLLTEADSLGSDWVFFDRLRPVSENLKQLQRSQQRVEWHGFSWLLLSADLGFKKSRSNKS